MLLSVLTSGQSSGRYAVVLELLVAITVGLTVHEFAHAYAPTGRATPRPVANGRVSSTPSITTIRSGPR